ncbi:hypothetical protein UFOVP345_3 [uncultured Caudovirales phage]|uniref:Uncharacterized protein n=1 Tax=uncultured Caudovirales phage TaxID=2100421 RepID=A0A6J5M0R1_9CAUD|nr:hypothetical protein UFOVP345_3 [uncultured Caudovirales phage]CAB4161037.1 hypothetical protein UFOVP732_28 [uncultured Caudovirales phage]
MTSFYLTVTDDDDTTTTMSFQADEIGVVLERLTALLAASAFPYVNDIVAVSYDEGGDEDEDVYFYADGTRMTGREIDAALQE